MKNIQYSYDQKKVLFIFILGFTNFALLYKAYFNTYKKL